MSAKPLLFKLLVLLLVIFIWITHSLLKVHHTEIELPLVIVNLGSDLIAVGDKPETVSISVEGIGLDIYNLKRQDSYIEIDADEAEFGVNSFLVTEQSVVYQDQNFRKPVQFQLNTTVEIEFDYIDTKNVVIEKRFLTLEDELFFNQRNASLKPEYAQVRGAKSLIAEITSIRTIPITAEAIEAEDYEIELEIPENAESIEPQRVETVLEAPVITSRTIPLIRIEFPEDRGVIIIPQYVTIQIEGTAGIVNSIRPGMIKAYVEQPEQYVNNFAPISFNIPEDVEIIKHTPRRVQVIPADQNDD